jgi:hypothetical protein
MGSPKVPLTSSTFCDESEDDSRVRFDCRTMRSTIRIGSNPVVTLAGEDYWLPEAKLELKSFGTAWRPTLGAPCLRDLGSQRALRGLKRFTLLGLRNSTNKAPFP